MKKILVMKKLNSNIDEVIRVVLKSLFIYFFYKEFLHAQKV